MTDLRPRQQELLQFICDFIPQHGYPPTIRDIVKGTSHVTTSVVDYNLDQLARRGYLKRIPGVSRGIIITSAQSEGVREEMKAWSYMVIRVGAQDIIKSINHQEPSSGAPDIWNRQNMTLSEFLNTAGAKGWQVVSHQSGDPETVIMGLQK